MKITPEQAREALDAWICRPGMTQEQATILITEAFWALKERPNIDVQRVTDEGGAVDQRALGVNRVKIFERWKGIDTRDKREKFTALVPAIMEANEKYKRWVKTQPCACCGKPADDPHHLIGHGQGGMGTKSHDIFTLPLCREHHNELHADPLAFEEKHGSQVDLIFRFLDHAFATGVLG